MTFVATIEKTRKDIEKKLAETGAIDVVVGASDLAVKKIREAQATVVSAPEQVKALPTKAQAVFGEAVATALTAYGDLAARGNDLVTRVRRQQATQDLKAQASTTVSQAQATTTTAKKSTRSTKTAVKPASTTAKKNAAKTTTRAKSTATSAKKTASAAKKAGKATASKAGTK